MIKRILLLVVITTAYFSAISQVKVFYVGETQCAYVVDDNMIYESGSTKCTKRQALYDIKENTVYYHNTKEPALVVKGDEIWYGSRNKDEIDRVMWVIKGNELVYPDRQKEAAFIIEDNKVYYGSNNKVKRKDRQILNIEGDIPKPALYMILLTLSYR